VRWSDSGQPLEDWLAKNKNKLKGARILYVIKSNSHLGVFKPGIAGYASSGSGAYGRLKSYVNTYGRADPMNPCSGARLYYLESSGAGPNVPRRNSRIYKREQLLHKTLKKLGLSAGRGKERTIASRAQIERAMRTPSFRNAEDVVPPVRRSKRLAKDKKKK